MWTDNGTCPYLKLPDAFGPGELNSEEHRIRDFRNFVVPSAFTVGTLYAQGLLQFSMKLF